MRTGNAHGHQTVVEVWVDLQCFLKMRRSLIVSVACAQGHAQIVFYAEIRWSNCERVLKQSEAVTPALNLGVRKHGKNQQNPPGYCCAERWRDTPALRDLGYSEHQRDEQADGRNIEIAVCHDLPAHLNESYNRDECSEEPKPAHYEVGCGFPLQKTKHRNSNQQKRCADNLPSGYARKRIIHCQIIRPESEQEVFRIRHNRVGQSDSNRIMGECAHSASTRLRHQSHNG